MFSDMSTHASRGSIAGSTGDGGVQYRRGVAAYIVSCGFAGRQFSPIAEAGVSLGVRVVALETNDAVDDIRIELDSDVIALVQAKRTLAKGRALREVVKQWADAHERGLNPATHRLVAVSGELEGPTRHLPAALHRLRLPVPGSLTSAEAEIVEHVKELLTEHGVADPGQVLRCAFIWKLAVEEPRHKDAEIGISYLQQVVDGKAQLAETAWTQLVDVVGEVARLRGGLDLAGWHAELRKKVVEFTIVGSTPAARFERTSQVLDRYRERVRRDGAWLQLLPLGAKIGRIRVDDADARIPVALNPDDHRETSKLLWAFLRRSRMVLTGLPGGGKSTELGVVAARLCDVPDAPLPLRVSLRSVNKGDRSRSFRDRLLDVAVRDTEVSDRAALRDELERRLTSGQLALLLDGLDETYDDRSEVVAEIDRFLDDVSPDTFVLLATRDVAYSDAATLEWPSVRLLPPLEIEQTMTAILRKAAGRERDNPAAWVAARLHWVMRVLEENKTLRETPLIPVLLTILATNRPEHRLPARRAFVLTEVVRDLLAPYELKRANGKPLGQLNGSLLSQASTHAFGAEAAVILSRGGQIDQREAVEAIANELRELWNLNRYEATAAATDAVRFFDESGLFVISGAEGTVSPRLMLFAEVGDALRVADRPELARSWVPDRIRGQQLEALILASALSEEVVAVFVEEVQQYPEDLSLVRALARAVAEGAAVSEPAIRWLCDVLIRDIATGTDDGWSSWSDLYRLPMPEDARAAAERAASTHSLSHAIVVKAGLDLKFVDRSTMTQAPQVLLDVLALQGLPRQTGKNRKPFQPSKPDPALTDVQVAAAEVLLGAVPEATALIVDRASIFKDALHRPLQSLLLDRGFQAEAEEVKTRLRRQLTTPGTSRFSHLAQKLRQFDRTRKFAILHVLAEGEQAELTAAQAGRLDELADLVTLLGLDEIGAQNLLSQPDNFLWYLADTVAALYGLDLGIVATQAQVTLDRLDECGSDAPYYSLFDHTEFGNAARKARRPDWSTVDAGDAAELLVWLFVPGWAQANFALRTLSLAPAHAATVAVPALRDLLPQLGHVPFKRRAAAHALCSLVDGPEPASWVEHADPSMRAIAATLICPTSHTFERDLRLLLDDPDGDVQVNALKTAVAAGVADLEALLLVTANRPDPIWVCETCEKAHDGNNTCSQVGPSPQELARKLLEDHVAEHAPRS
ncbi:NACHT domain-containing protein [Lentzea sp. NPDC058450]|uniref:NACHT domain-containing protein n=1 Tax=Lentzea sp. NPDC058450 TaxID=3346505 RepID=UPI003650A991